jgi:recombination protein RecR
MIPKELATLISYLKKLSGVGGKTAERFAFELLEWEEGELASFGALVGEIQKKVPLCPTCGCLAERAAPSGPSEEACRFCSPGRDPSSLCILASPKEVYAIEQTGVYQGLYHVIEHLLSPLDGRHASGLNIERLKKRIADNKVAEVLIAFDSTLEGDATALYLKEQLADSPVSFSRLAFGLPVGTPLAYIDPTTLQRALVGKQKI